MNAIQTIKIILGTAFLLSLNTMATPTPQKLRVATFNVSMEALNYVDKNDSAKINGNELLTALKANHQQIRNIAEIIQRINPDILLLNEFDFAEQQQANSHQALELFINNYLAKPQQGQKAVNFPYYYQGKVNTGVKAPFDLNSDGEIDQPADTHGFGYFPGHFGMVLLSKYPLDKDNIRTFELFKWHDMPNALKPIDPVTNKPWYSKQAWLELRLSSKSHWDIPVFINGKKIHILASHPTPPVFDGPEDRNGKRNHDEIRFWHDYITANADGYIYDDKHVTGGIKDDLPFIIMGDQNASATEGDAYRDAISSLLTHSKIQDPLPTSLGGQQHSPDNPLAKHHSAYWRMRADYVLPSKAGFKLLDSGVFWPTKESSEYRLIADRSASSDHRLVWLDLKLTQ